MASNKRKQDERHLKMLREMAGLPSNKQCFDCHQRGPTYVNMMTGSYVCTSCSGILRGLIPPHRVKSISMASFTTDEMEFVKCHGNDFCRKVWLGLYDSRSMPEPDSREEQRVKDFMVQKYEKKRWYVAPTESMKDEARHQNELVLANLNTKSTRPLKSLLGENTPKLTVQNNQAAQSTGPTSLVNQVARPTQSSHSAPLQIQSPNQPPVAAVGQAAPPPKQSATMDLLGELGGDPFASNAPTTAPPPPASGGGGGFADFANFSAQPVSSAPGFPTPNPAAAPLQPMGTNTAAPAANTGFGAFGSTATSSQPAQATAGMGGGDRYAALADLSTVFGSSPGSSSSSTNVGSGPVAGHVQAPANVNWSGGSSSFNWSGQGGGGGGPINWNSSGSNAGSSGLGWGSSTGQTAAPSTSVFSSSSSTAANPFGSGPPGMSQQAPLPAGGMGANPFGGGGGAGQPGLFANSANSGGGFGQFGQNPSPQESAGFGQFGMQAQPQGGAQQGGFGGMQNGGFGMMGPPSTASTGQFGFSQSGPGFTSGNMAGGAQFGKPTPGAGGGFGGTAPGFGGGGGWGTNPGTAASNPFMSAATQQQMPPRSNATNPFL